MLSISREHKEAQIKAESAPLPTDNWLTIEKETLRSFHQFPTANSQLGTDRSEKLHKTPTLIRCDNKLAM